MLVKELAAPVKESWSFFIVAAASVAVAVVVVMVSVGWVILALGAECRESIGAEEVQDDMEEERGGEVDQ